MNNLLPTLDLMKERYLNIITIALYLFCNKHTESLNHLVICSKLDSEWRNIILNVLNKTKKSIKRALDINVPIEHIRRSLLEDCYNEWIGSRYLEGLLRDF